MTLPALRAQIEKVDAEIVRLLNIRTRLCIRMGSLKRKLRRPSFLPEREESLLGYLEKKRGRGPLPADALRAIYREILSSSRAQQKPVVVGYLRDGDGIGLTAAWYRFGAGETYRPSRTWTDLCRALRAKKIDVALCSASALAREKKRPLPGLRLCGEVRLPGQTGAAGHFFLLERGDVEAKPGTLFTRHAA